MSTRTDCHRPGAIVPADYEYLTSYALPDNEGFGAYNLERARALGAAAPRMFGHTGKCGVCGASYRYGDVWRHVPTGEAVHLGHDCADKYDLLAARPEFNAALEAIKRARAARIAAEANRLARESFFARHPGLAEALATDHPICRDMLRKLGRYHSLSDKQVALAFKLQADASRPPRPPERNVPAPVSDKRQTIRGRVVSLKSHEGSFRTSIKMTVKVETPDGSWLAWGTRPSSLSALGDDMAEVGDIVQFDALLEAGESEDSKPHFGFFKRATKGKVLERRRRPETPKPVEPSPEVDPFAEFDAPKTEVA